MTDHIYPHWTVRLLFALCFISIPLSLVLFFQRVPIVHAATITVQSTADGAANPLNCPGASCRLRDAIAAANPAGGDIIDFSLTLPAIITLISDELSITKTLTINGPGAPALLTISGNNATRVISVTSGITLNLSNVTIANGKAVDSGGGKAVDSGGGIYNAGTLTISNTAFYSNSAGFYGGGLFNNGTLTMSNSTVYSNSASSGSGLYNSVGTLTMTDSALAGNSASNLGGGIRRAAGMVTLLDTIVANSPSGGNCSGTIASLGYNLDSLNTCAFSAMGDITNTNPLLGPLANNGGPTQTMTLFVGSAAIDRIPNGTNGCGTTIMTDQRGILRPQGAACDIGAYEYDGPLYPLFLPIIQK